MERLLLAVAVVAIAAAIGEVVRRRRAADPPTQPRFDVPAQIDRSDFDGDGWLVAVFTSDSCSTCADVVSKAMVVAGPEVDVHVASFQDARRIHDRYRIDAVPCVLIADGDGVVHRSFIGPVTATDLWAAVAEARNPGTIERRGECEH